MEFRNFTRQNFKTFLYLIKDRRPLSQILNYFKYIFHPAMPYLYYKPINLNVVSTHSCTLHCDMCITHSPLFSKNYVYAQEPTPPMSKKVIERILQLFPEAINVDIIGGGEPILNPEFFEIVKLIKSSRKTAKTFSNGTHLDKYVEKLLESGLDNITVSVNSYCGSDYKRLTGHGEEVFEKIKDNVKLLVKKRNESGKKMKIKASFIVDKINYKYMDKMLLLADELGVDYVFLCNFLPSPFSGFREAERTLCEGEPKDYSFYLERAKSLGFTKVEYPVLLPKKEDRKKRRCNTFFFQLRINGRGDVGSCSIMRLNLKTGVTLDSRDIWNHPYFQRERKRYLGEDLPLPTPCRSCTSNFYLKEYE